MKNLLPTFIQEQYIKGNYEGRFYAFTMFVDISGFTGMTEALMKNGIKLLRTKMSSLKN